MTVCLWSCVSDLEGIGLPKSMYLRQTVTFFAFAAPPVDENGIAFGRGLMLAPHTSDWNLGWVGRLVADWWHVLWNRPLPLTSDGVHGREQKRKNLKEILCHPTGTENMCDDFCEIWTKFEDLKNKSVFWRNVKIVENLSWRKWAWPIWNNPSRGQESQEKGILNLRPTVQKL